MDNIEKDDDFSIWDINSLVNFIKNNIKQLLLFILVFLIIYVVEYIQNINIMIYSISSPIPGLNNVYINKSNIKNTKNIKKNKSLKK